MTTRVAASSSCCRVVSVSLATLAIAGSASPRNPIVRIPHSSSALRSFDVAWRSSASAASRGDIPQPSSTTRIAVLPVTSMLIVRAPASIALSTSSLTTEAGRSMTSPAAI